MGHAVLLADTIAQTLYQGVGVVQLWNTRWTENPVPGHVSGYDALLEDNTRTATGATMEVLSRMTWGELLTTSSTSRVRVFASRDASGAVTILLLNKDTGGRDVSISINNYTASSSTVPIIQLAGNGPLDEHPTITTPSAWKISSGKIVGKLPAVSISVLRLSGRAT